MSYGKGKIKNKNKVQNPTEYYQKTMNNFSLRMANKFKTSVKFFTNTFIVLDASGKPIKVRHGVTREEFLNEVTGSSEEKAAIYEWRQTIFPNIWAVSLIQPNSVMGQCFIRTGQDSFISIDKKNKIEILQLYYEMEEARKIFA